MSQEYSPEMMAQMAADQGAGNDSVGNQDIAIPFLTILQSLSPQVKAGNQQIEGAKEGMIFNTVTQEIMETVDVINCAFQKAYVEWIPRHLGGGFVQSHVDVGILEQCTEKEDANGKKILVLPNGNQIVETCYHSVMIASNMTPAVMSMSSTQITESRKWNSMIKSIRVMGPEGDFNPPRYSHIYTCGTKLREKANNSWYVWDIKIKEMIGSMDMYKGSKTLSLESKSQMLLAAPPEDGAVDSTPVTDEF